MRDGKGYLIPSNIAPDGHRCLLLFCPDDDEYLYNLHGAFFELTKWLSHEKDGTDNAALVAQRWRDAYELTMLCGWNNGVIMSCSEAKFDELIAAIVTIGDKIDDSSQLSSLGMEAIKTAIYDLITSNQDISIGDQINNVMLDCAGCGDVQVDIEPPSPPYDPNVPPVGADLDEFKEYLCDAATFMYESYMMDTYDTLAGYGAGLATIGSATLIVILAASGIGMPLVLILSLAQVILTLVGAGSAQAVRDELEGVKSEIICALVNSSGTAQALASIDDVIDTEGVGINAASILHSYFAENQLNKLYGGDIAVPVSYVGSACPCENATGWYEVHDVDNIVMQEGIIYDGMILDLIRPAAQSLQNQGDTRLWLIKIWTDSSKTTRRGYDVFVTAEKDWAEPNNLDHPIIFQGRSAFNQVHVDVIPYGTAPPYVPSATQNTDWVALHSDGEFDVRLRFDPPT